MFNSDTEVLFPSRVIATLRTLHGDEWRDLLDHVRSAGSAPAERHAFVLMMVRMCGCVGCNADSFRAMRGCTQCARQAARRFRGGDHEFVEQYRQVLKEVETYLQKLQAGTAGAPVQAGLAADEVDAADEFAMLDEAEAEDEALDLDEAAELDEDG